MGELKEGINNIKKLTVKEFKKNMPCKCGYVGDHDFIDHSRVGRLTADGRRSVLEKKVEYLETIIKQLIQDAIILFLHLLTIFVTLERD